MNFLIDAQLPRRMVQWFVAVGFESSHTLDLPLANRTPDADVAGRANQGNSVLITKDGDFVDSHLLLQEPAKLLLISTGNISNRELEQLVVPVISRIAAYFERHSFLELGRSGLIVRE